MARVRARVRIRARGRARGRARATVRVSGLPDAHRSVTPLRVRGSGEEGPETRRGSMRARAEDRVMPAYVKGTSQARVRVRARSRARVRIRVRATRVRSGDWS